MNDLRLAMPLYWLVYRHNKSQSSSSLELRSFRAGMRAVLAGLDEGEFTDDPKWRTTEWNEEP